MGILNKLEKSGENHKILENSEFQTNIIFYFLVIFKINCVLFAKIDQVFSLKEQDIKKILEKWKKYWKSSGILSVRKSGKYV